MRLRNWKKLGLLLGVVVAVALGTGAVIVNGVFKFAPGGGDLSPYSVGFYDVGGDGEASVYLVNPTPYDLVALVFQFDCDGNPVRCGRIPLTPNDFGKFDVQCNRPSQGAIKVLSVKTPFPASTVWAQSGVVGWVRHDLPSWENERSHSGGIGDTNLVPVPNELLTASSNFEFNRLVDFANSHCSGLPN